MKTWIIKSTSVLLNLKWLHSFKYHCKINFVSERCKQVCCCECLIVYFFLMVWLRLWCIYYQASKIHWNKRGKNRFIHIHKHMYMLVYVCLCSVKGRKKIITSITVALCFSFHSHSFAYNFCCLLSFHSFIVYCSTFEHVLFVTNWQLSSISSLTKVKFEQL